MRITQNLFFLVMAISSITAMQDDKDKLNNELLMELMKEKADQTKVTQLLNTKLIKLNKVHSPSNDSFLHYAIFHDENFACAQLLLQYGAQVNARNHLGETPLHEAIMYLNKRCITILIANAADVNAQTVTGKTPMHYLCYFHKKENPYDFKEIMNLLLSRGVDLRLRDDNGNAVGDLLQ